MCNSQLKNELLRSFYLPGTGFLSVLLGPLAGSCLDVQGPAGPADWPKKSTGTDLKDPPNKLEGPFG